MTTAAACAPFGTGSMQVRFGEPMAVVQAVEHVLLDHPPWSLETRLPVELSGAAASIALPPLSVGALRRTVRLNGWAHVPVPFVTMRAGTSGF